MFDLLAGCVGDCWLVGVGTPTRTVGQLGACQHGISQLECDYQRGFFDLYGD